MSVNATEPARISTVQRLAMILGVLVTLILVSPLVDDLTHRRHLSWGTWLAELAPFLIGVSLAVGLVAAVRALDGHETAGLDRFRRRVFWVGVALIPVAWLLPLALG
jgi:hypothetical protein